MRMERRAPGLAVALAALVPWPGLGQAPPYESPPEDLPREVGPQPIPFDHRLHVENRIACADCHPGSRAAPRAGLPDRDQCMQCHQAIAADKPAVQQLAALPAGSKIQWQRAYQVPDFVFFSHAEHAKGSLACADCHGPVQERRVLMQEVSTNMVACMNCHALRQVSNECFLCHDLGQ